MVSTPSRIGGAVPQRDEDGGRIVLHSPSKQALRVLKIAGLTGDGLLYGDRDAALAALDT
jgi:hypothetical protein